MPLKDVRLRRSFPIPAKQCLLLNDRLCIPIGNGQRGWEASQSCCVAIILMRGVTTHSRRKHASLRFCVRPPPRTNESALYVSLATLVIAIGLIAFVTFSKPSNTPTEVTAPQNAENMQNQAEGKLVKTLKGGRTGP
jgi:hypothetical protein